MDKLQHFSAEFFKFLEASGFANKDLVLLAALGLSLVALLLTVSGAFVKQILRSNTDRELADRVEELSEELKATRAKYSDELMKFWDRLGRLEDSMSAADEPLTAEFSREELTLVEEQAKKKTEVADSSSSESPAEAPESVISLTSEYSDDPSEVEKHAEESTSIVSGLKKTRGHLFARLKSIFREGAESGAETFSALEEVLLTADIGVKTTQHLLDSVRASLKGKNLADETTLRDTLKGAIVDLLKSSESADLSVVKRENGAQVVLFVGVNGVGKTTTIGKLADRLKQQGSRVLVAACDTFRAAAVEQLQEWGRRAGVDVVAGEEGAKPSTVAYRAIHKARDEGYDVLLIDTAGRLHTRVNLMNELKSLVGIIEREQPGAPHETILVLDASTGQNGLQQAREFNEAADLSGVVITKLDGTSKGGIVIAIRDELQVPIRYIGVGEQAGDLKTFSATEFTEALFVDDVEAVSLTFSQEDRSPKTEKRITRGRRRGREAEVGA